MENMLSWTHHSFPPSLLSLQSCCVCRWQAGETSALWHSWSGWIRQAQASVLHQHGHLLVVLQRGEPFVLPECEWEVGSWNSLPLPQGAHYPGWDTVRPPGGCQSPHRAGQVQRKACLGGGCKALCWGNKSHILHRVLRFDSEKPQGGLWCSHRGWYSVLGYPAATKEIQM